ncbi:MAG: Hpt domain-containing protein, partial [Gammaproteobacteria bacterium]|nr:Hpt domain-containing protein [Gammaproteobacteria bacterium]
EFEQELFAAYLEDCVERIERLHTALADGDAVTFNREAHTVKGASANVGTTRLHEMAQALESADFADTGTISALISDVDAEFQCVKAAIEAYLATL